MTSAECAARAFRLPEPTYERAETRLVTYPTAAAFPALPVDLAGDLRWEIGPGPFYRTLRSPAGARTPWSAFACDGAPGWRVWLSLPPRVDREVDWNVEDLPTAALAVVSALAVHGVRVFPCAACRRPAFELHYLGRGPLCPDCAFEFAKERNLSLRPAAWRARVEWVQMTQAERERYFALREEVGW